MDCFDAKTDYLKRRRELLKNQQVPTISEAKNVLGEPLSAIVFKQCEDALKEDFGLKPPLNGAGSELWISPSDLLIGKVCLKPPLTSKHIQALTHQGILEIGLQMERKFWNESEMAREKELREQEKILRILFDVEKQKIKGEIRKEEKEFYTNEMEHLIEEMEDSLIRAIESLEKKMARDEKIKLKQYVFHVEQEWQQKLARAIDDITKKLQKLHEKELSRQQEDLTHKFEMDLKKTEMRAKYMLENSEAKYNDSLKTVKHDLECRNIANMMFIICVERRKCSAEKSTLVEQYDDKIKSLQESNETHTKEVEDLKNERDFCKKHIVAREKCLFEIIKQFQKFINFALKACPTQAEFLLCVEKMLVFELTDSLDKVGDDIEKNVQKLSLIDEKNDVIAKPKKVADIEPGIKVEDFHNCCNEPDPPRGKHEEYGPEDNLPAMFLHKLMYVREDFKNMISQGKELSPDNLLWNTDVAMVTEKLKTKQKSPSPTHSKCSQKLRDKLDTMSHQSSVRFNFGEEAMKKPSKDKSLLKLNDDDEINVNFHKVGTEERRKTLISSKNSVEIFKEKLSHETKASIAPVGTSMGSSDVDRNEYEIKNHKFSNTDPMGIFHRIPTVDEKKDTDSLMQSDFVKVDLEKRQRRESKLSLARDSLIIKRTSVVGSLHKSIDHKVSLHKSPSDTDSVKLSHKRMSRVDCFPVRERTMSTVSRLSVAKDSVTLLKEKTSKESLRRPQTSGRRRSVGLNESIPTGERQHSVEFEMKTDEIPIDVNHTYLVPYLSDSHRDMPKVDKKDVKKKPFKNRIVGDRTLKVHLQKDGPFTQDRIHSFIRIMRDNPQLLRTFTACSR